MTAATVFELAVNAYLRELSDAEFEALVRRVRPPKKRSTRRGVRTDRRG